MEFSELLKKCFPKKTKAMNKLFLGVDTSNYTTSLALCDDMGNVLANIRRLLEVQKGQKGLRQSDALFLHTKALPALSKELFSVSGYNPESLCAVGVSTKPRDTENSYMPCFLSGFSFASGISDAFNIPLYTFSHQACHIEAAVSSCENKNIFESEKFISFHVSGGTTEALICKYNGKSYECQIVGGTNDASAGQIIDRLGVLLGLGFPCGKELDRICTENKQSEVFRPHSSMKGSYFSMSGLENKVKGFIENGKMPQDIAHFVFSSIALSLSNSLDAIRQEYGYLPALFTGGVMSNSLIRQVLSSIPDVYFASTALSSDNAVGTALLAQKTYIKKEKLQ